MALTVKPGMEAVFVEKFKTIIEPTRAEAGNVFYYVHIVEGGKKVVAYEAWNDAAALDAHFATPHIQQFIGDTSDMLLAPPALEILNLVSTVDDRLTDATKAEGLIHGFGILKLKEGGKDEFLARQEPLVNGTRSEAGNRTYELLQSQKDPNSFYAYEIFENQTAIDQHFLTQHVQDFLGSVGPFLVGPPQLTYSAIIK